MSLYVQAALSLYIESGRDSYAAVQQRVLRQCDLIADGMLPPDALADTIAEISRNRLSQITP